MLNKIHAFIYIQYKYQTQLIKNIIYDVIEPNYFYNLSKKQYFNHNYTLQFHINVFLAIFFSKS